MMKRSVSHAAGFSVGVLRVIAGCLFVVGTVAFVAIPWSLGGHPGDSLAMSASTAYHPT